MIWFCLLIPIITIVILLWFFHKHVVWWEYLLLIAVPSITVVIANYTAIHFQTSDTEYWNTYGTKASHYEAWNEWVEETCSREVCTGSGKDETCTTEYYDCSYEDNHPEYWEIIDNTGHSFSINPSFFNHIVNLWGNKTFQDMHRDYYTYDGDAYHTIFQKPEENLQNLVPICNSHTYENRVMVSKSVFNFQEVDTATIREYQLFEYPRDNRFNFNPILGYNDRNASDKLNRYNALYGSSKQLHMMILVFNNKPFDAGMMQESYWKGGNKNEFILCVGVNNNKITWTKIISWTEVESLKIKVKSDVMLMDTLNMDGIVDYMIKEVPRKFVRKKFADFNYLKIEPSTRAVIITFFITLIFSVGLGIFVVKNDVDI